MAGTIKAGMLSDGTRTRSMEELLAVAPRAYVVMNTMATPIEIKSQYNISSVTDHGVGNYTLNFAKPMPSTNYYMSWGTLSDFNNGGGTLNVKGYGAYDDPASPLEKTLTSYRILHWAGGSLYDSYDLHVIIGGG